LRKSKALRFSRLWILETLPVRALDALVRTWTYAIRGLELGDTKVGASSEPFSPNLSPQKAVMYDEK
jgi:hypothetical protein